MGTEEWEAWQRACLTCAEKNVIPNTIPTHKGDGLTIGALIWVGSKEYPSTLFHEAQHALSAIFDFLGCADEEEMKAYISGYMNNEVHKWLLK